MDHLQHYSSPENMTTKKSDDLVVSDHKGLVVVWQDGHRSRFSWTGLRRLCRCAECQQRNGSHNPLSDRSETTVEQ